MYGSLGSLDTAAAYYSEAPVPVYGGARFKQLTTLYHTVCGLQLNGSALCWGGERLSSGSGLAAHRSRLPRKGGQATNRLVRLPLVPRTGAARAGAAPGSAGPRPACCAHPPPSMPHAS